MTVRCLSTTRSRECQMKLIRARLKANKKRWPSQKSYLYQLAHLAQYLKYLFSGGRTSSCSVFTSSGPGSLNWTFWRYWYK